MEGGHRARSTVQGTERHRALVVQTRCLEREIEMDQSLPYRLSVYYRLDCLDVSGPYYNFDRRFQVAFIMSND
jgi:hypothetical protein